MKAYEVNDKDGYIGWLIMFADSAGKAKQKYINEVSPARGYPEVEYVDVRAKRKPELDKYDENTLPFYIYEELDRVRLIQYVERGIDQ